MFTIIFPSQDRYFKLHTSDRRKHSDGPRVWKRKGFNAIIKTFQFIALIFLSARQLIAGVHNQASNHLNCYVEGKSLLEMFPNFLQEFCNQESEWSKICWIGQKLFFIHFCCRRFFANSPHQTFFLQRLQNFLHWQKSQHCQTNI